MNERGNMRGNTRKLDVNKRYDVSIVGGGVAGLSAGIFTARAGLDTLVIHYGRSILQRNAHLENYPGFPAGINPRLLLDMLKHQVREAGCELFSDEVTSVTQDGAVFVVNTRTRTVLAEQVIVASWSDTAFLSELDLETREVDGKQRIAVNSAGRTNIDGLYAAGRLADQYHQAIVAAGHGAQVGLTVVNDADPEFYNDWTVPEGYFTNRGHAIPRGCEEIDAEERHRRERESVEVLHQFTAHIHDSMPEQHPEATEES